MGSKPDHGAASSGGSAYGHATVNGLLREEAHEAGAMAKMSPIHGEVLKTFRILIADLCEQFAGGHPGSAMGMAAIGVALWKYVMRYAPHSPTWFNRDRFVLSNGHTCLFQYTFLYLSGYKEMTLEKLKGYHSNDPETICPGHPEMENDGIEVTTGPLGQGIANAVGLAAGARHLGATFNQPVPDVRNAWFDVVDCHIWCTVGDACLQEGVGLEAISLAGHWKLGNLTVIYDNNQITCDGSVDLTNTEDINSKMRACGWEVLDVWDGCFDIEALVDAMRLSKRSHDRPTFINVRTIIGVGSAVAGDAIAHGAALQKDDVAGMKKAYGFDPDRSFVLSDQFHDFFSDIPTKGEQHVKDWHALFDSYRTTYPKLAAALEDRIAGKLPDDWEASIPGDFGNDAMPLRKAAGKVLDPLAAKIPAFMVGTADLSPSVHMAFEGAQPFNHPSHVPVSGTQGDYRGRYVHYGVREHAMCAVANGLAAFHPGTFRPVTSSFLMFYLYAAPAVRMGALMRLPVVHAATHDSVGMGEDGPTHQPLELGALFRAMPNLLFFRPGDAEEVAGAWMAALRRNDCPSIVSASRHAVKQFIGHSNRAKVEKGGYVLEEADGTSTAEATATANGTSNGAANHDTAASSENLPADVTLVSCGAELEIAAAAAAVLRSEHGRRVRLVSMPCFRLFEKQPRAYQRAVLQRHRGVPAVAIEAYVGVGWERHADAGCVMSKDRFGVSAPGKVAYRYFGFTGESIAARVQKYLEGLVPAIRDKNADAAAGHEPAYVLGEWVEL